MFEVLKDSLEYLQNANFFERDFYFERLKSFLKQNNVGVLLGQRRVWKSSILVSFFKKLYNWEKIFYINKELDINDEIKNYKDLNEVFSYFKKKFGDPKFVIIDEIQDINGWEKFIRKLVSLKKYKIFITGSNSKLLSGELATYLTGRYISLEIYPFSYKEFLQIKWLKDSKENFLQYLKVWGMPESLLIEDNILRQNYLKDLKDSIVLKDIVQRFKIKDVGLLEKILKFMADNVGNLISISNIYGYLKNIFKKEISLKTISIYVNYLKIAYLLHEVERYDLQGKKILEYIWKYYFTDIGIRNVFGFVFAKDVGKILENLVFIHLKRLWFKVYIWKLKDKEVDFVAEKNWEKIYIQVSYLLTDDKVIKREFGNLLKIKDNYPKVVLSLDETFGNTYEGVIHMNIRQFLLKDNIYIL